MSTSTSRRERRSAERPRPGTRLLRRLHSRLTDPALALLLLAVGLLGFALDRTPGGLLGGQRTPDALACALLALQTVSLIRRRRAPFAVFGVVLVATVALRVQGYPFTGADLASAVAFFSLAARDRPERTFQAAAAVAGGVIALTVLGLLPFETFVLLHLVFGAAWVLGNDRRRRRLRERTLAEQAEQARHDQEALVEHAITNERVRMAQELHDLAAHALGVIAIQAEAGRRALGRRPEQAGSALSAIGGMADEALADLRHLLGFLRGDEALARRPQPTVDDLGLLADGFRTAGLPVTLMVQGDLGRMSATLQTAIYRVVQEALTNTLKHAGYASARVVVSRSAEALEVEVVDTGRGAAPGSRPGEGLTGMRERITMLGGELRSGTGPEGGYSVQARLPAADRVSA